MTYRPILFSGPMVRALLDDRKTQTRRIAKLPNESSLGVWEPSTVGGTGVCDSKGAPVPEQPCLWHTRSGKAICSPWQRADTLWVRETWAPLTLGFAYRADPIWNAPPADRWRPSIFMPRAASRISLLIAEVRVERLQDISEEDAKAEGIFPHIRGGWYWREHNPHDLNDWHQFGIDTPQNAYRHLWESINGKGSWDLNPFVWALTFKRVATEVKP